MVAIAPYQENGQQHLDPETGWLILAAYLAGRADQRRVERDALAMIARTCRNMLRSVKQAKPTPREGIEAGLLLLKLAAEHPLGH